jgi:hypothetical protein
LWRLDLESETWEALQISGEAPEPRAGAASTSIGDRLYLFGGQGAEEMYTDLYVYDNRATEWSKEDAEGLPSARKYARMCSVYPNLFIVGGITLNGYSDEVWSIDIKDYQSTLLSSNNPTGPQPSAFSGCSAEMEDGYPVLYTYVGETTGEEPLEEVFKFTTKDQTWTSYGPLTPRSQAATLKANHLILVAGGEAWGTDSKESVYMMDLDNQKVVALGTLPSSIYGADSKYYKTTLYVFGGGDMFGTKLRSSVPVSNLSKLNLNVNCGEYCNWPCSIGTYQGGLCEPCTEGYYADKFGSTVCQPCPAGTFSTGRGNSSLRQCYPCAQGFYNPSPGSSACLSCPSGFVCDVGSSAPSLTSMTTALASSSQPDLFTTGTSKVDALSTKLQNGFIGLGCLTLLLVLAFKHKISSFVSSFDLFDSQHIYEEDVPLISHKNFFGGVFSLLFYICAGFYLLVAFLVYNYDNVEEIKALVPIVTLEKEYNDVPFI